MSVTSTGRQWEQGSAAAWPAASGKFAPLSGAGHLPVLTCSYVVCPWQVGGNWLAWWIVAAAGASQIGQFQAEMSSDSYQLLVGVGLG